MAMSLLRCMSRLSLALLTTTLSVKKLFINLINKSLYFLSNNTIVKHQVSWQHDLKVRFTHGLQMSVVFGRVIF